MLNVLTTFAMASLSSVKNTLFGENTTGIPISKPETSKIIPLTNKQKIKRMRSKRAKQARKLNR